MLAGNWWLFDIPFSIKLNQKWVFHFLFFLHHQDQNQSHKSPICVKNGAGTCLFWELTNVTQRQRNVCNVNGVESKSNREEEGLREMNIEGSKVKACRAMSFFMQYTERKKRSAF